MELIPSNNLPEVLPVPEVPYRKYVKTHTRFAAKAGKSVKIIWPRNSLFRNSLYTSFFYRNVEQLFLASVQQHWSSTARCRSFLSYLFIYLFIYLCILWIKIKSPVIGLPMTAVIASQKGYFIFNSGEKVHPSSTLTWPHAPANVHSHFK